jgi:ribonuclease HI
MELMGVIVALESITRNDIPVTIYTDSKYIVDSVEKKWLDGWIKTDFKGGKKNKDLWTRYYKSSRKFKIKFVWVKGHSGDLYNELVEKLAKG